MNKDNIMLLKLRRGGYTIGFQSIGQKDDYYIRLAKASKTLLKMQKNKNK